MMFINILVGTTMKITKGPKVSEVATTPISNVSGTLKAQTTFLVTFFPYFTQYDANKQLEA